MPSQPSPKGLSYVPPSSLCALPFPLPSYAWSLLLMNHSYNSMGNSSNHTSSPRGLCILLPCFGVQVKSHSSGQILYYLLPDWHRTKQFCSRKSLAALISLQNHRDHIEQRGLKESRGKYIVFILKVRLQDPKYLVECNPFPLVYTRLPAEPLEDLSVLSGPSGFRHQPPSRHWEPSNNGLL